MLSATFDTTADVQVIGAPGSGKTICITGLTVMGFGDVLATFRETDASGAIHVYARCKDGGGLVMPTTRDGYNVLGTNKSLFLDVDAAIRVVGTVYYVIEG